MIFSWFPEETMKPASAFSDKIMLLYSKFTTFYEHSMEFYYFAEGDWNLPVSSGNRQSKYSNRSCKSCLIINSKIESIPLI